MQVIKIIYANGETRYIMRTTTWRLTEQIETATRFKNNSQAFIFLADTDVLFQLGLMSGTSNSNEITKIEFEKVG